MLDDGSNINQTWLTKDEKNKFFINKTKERVRMIILGIHKSSLNRPQKLQLLEDLKKQIDSKAEDIIFQEKI